MSRTSFKPWRIAEAAFVEAKISQISLVAELIVQNGKKREPNGSDGENDVPKGAVIDRPCGS